MDMGCIRLHPRLPLSRLPADRWYGILQSVPSKPLRLRLLGQHPPAVRVCKQHGVKWGIASQLKKMIGADDRVLG